MKQTLQTALSAKNSQTSSLAQSSNISEPLHAALTAALRASEKGREVLQHYYGRLSNVEKKHQAGLVSEADKESEKVIFDYLRSQFPDDEFLGEESAYGHDSNLTAGDPQRRRWIVDPLDGTTNYIHQFPIFAISIAMEFQNEIQVGVIDMPKLNETYYAVKGHGSYVNDKKMQVSSCDDIENAFLATGFISDFEDVISQQLAVFSKLVRQCRGIRRAGAAAYDLTQVARGVFDGYWERNLKPWDSAAGILLVREAGGLVSTYAGSKYSPYDNTLVATGPKLHSKLLSFF